MMTYADERQAARKAQAIIAALAPNLSCTDANLLAVRDAGSTARDAIRKLSSEAALDFVRGEAVTALSDLCRSMERDLVTQEMINHAGAATASWISELGIILADEAEKKRELKEDLLRWHEFENKQLDRRVTWQGQFHGFLFAALALAWIATNNVLLIKMIAWLGLAIAFAGICAIGPVGKSLVNIARERREIDPKGEIRIFGYLIGTDARDWAYFPGPEVAIPVLFFGAWGFILWLAYFHADLGMLGSRLLD